MALKADINSNENLAHKGTFSKIIENGQILLLNEPFMVYTQDNIESDCAIVLDPITEESSQNLKLPKIIFDGNYYQFENIKTNNFPNEFQLRDDFRCVDEGQQVDDGLAVLKILCNNGDNHPLDQPEFVDVSSLTEIDKTEDIKENEVLSINISDDDDVVFVKEYKGNDEKRPKSKQVTESNNKMKIEYGIRRNPVRKVRTQSRDLSKEHIFEEDFAFLDTSEEEGEAEEKENKIPNQKTTGPNDNFKKWPVNVHERPEYNTATNKIEAFDYTIRDIQKKAPIKKPRLETVPIRRKPKKKYYTRKRKPRVVEVKKVPIEEVKFLVDTTTKLLKDFLIESRQFKELVNPELRKSKIHHGDNLLEALKNQIILYSIINNLDHRRVKNELDLIGCTECTTCNIQL